MRGKSTKFFLKYLIIFIGISILPYSCQKDENFEVTETLENTTNFSQSTVLVNNGNNVSKKAINFLKKRTNNTFKVAFNKNNISLYNGDVNKKFSSSGNIRINKEVVLVNKRNKKHTFLVETPNEASNSITNVVVVQTKTYTYEYFIKYTFAKGIAYNLNSSQVDLSNFSGTIQTINNNGRIIGTRKVNNGEITHTFGDGSPCPDSDDPVDPDVDDEDNSNTGGSTSGGIPGGTGNFPNSGDNHGGLNTSGGGWIEGDGPCGLNYEYVCSNGYGGDHDPTPIGNGHLCSGTNSGSGILTVTDCRGNGLGFGRSADTPNSCTGGSTGVIIPPNDYDCLPGFSCRSGEILDKDCECQIDLSDPCANRDLINYKVSTDVLSTLESRQQPNSMVQSSEMVDSFMLETIDDGWGEVNQDRFSVKIDQLPNGYSAFQLFDEIRMNFTNLVVGGDIPFLTDVNLKPYSSEDSIKWNSNNPVGAAMDFNTKFDTSTVYCVEYNEEEMYWVFATVTSYDHQGHFVAGIRQFGLELNGSGGYSFYVRAADRLGGVLDSMGNTMLDVFSNESLFTLAGDSTWKNLMENTTGFIQNKGGTVNEFDENEIYGARYPYKEGDCPE